MNSEKRNTPSVSTHLGYFGGGGDRYCLAGYQEATAPLDRIRRVSGVEGLDGVELNFPALVSEESVADFQTALADGNLACSSLSMNIWGAGMWRAGSLSSPDPDIRQTAVDTVVRGMQVAKALGTRLVSIWPGQDGFDYPFQVHYGNQVDLFVGGLQTCADSDPEVRICIEYKPKEPRTHILTDTCARTMWLLGKIGRPNVGVLLDVGHGLFAGENVAQSAVLLQREGLLDLVHFNDNYGDWDWDMIPGTLRFWELLELIFWLRQTGYAGWSSIDIAVARGDPVEACRLSVTNIRRLWKLAERLDPDAVLRNLNRTDDPANLRLVSQRILGPLLEG